jgi:hypothetical protein
MEEDKTYRNHGRRQNLHKPWKKTKLTETMKEDKTYRNHGRRQNFQKPWKKQSVKIVVAKFNGKGQQLRRADNKKIYLKTGGISKIKSVDCRLAAVIRLL